MPRKPNLQAIEAQIRKLQQRAEQLKKANKAPIVADILRRMRDHGITLDDLRAGERNGKGAARTRRPAAIKYRHPQTGETWTGRGRPPRWLASAEAAGAKREDFAV